MRVWPLASTGRQVFRARRLDEAVGRRVGCDGAVHRENLPLLLVASIVNYTNRPCRMKVPAYPSCSRWHDVRSAPMSVKCQQDGLQEKSGDTVCACCQPVQVISPGCGGVWGSGSSPRSISLGLAVHIGHLAYRIITESADSTRIARQSVTDPNESQISGPTFRHAGGRAVKPFTPSGPSRPLQPAANRSGS